ncbi:MAG TPA: potassium-transporting ATPase subunit KdpA [Thermoleophilia bacterium]
MSGQGIAQILVYAVVLVALGYPLGVYMARVYGDRFLVSGPFGWLRGTERGFYRLVRTDAKKEQGWKSYGKTVLIFSVVVMGVLYGIQRLQGHLFLNPDHMKAVPPHLALNTAASFITNTNWQYYGGEYTMSYLSQMAGLAVQNFVSAAVGMAVLAAVVRGIARRSAGTLGNFWVDLYRSLVYILLPLCLILSALLIWQGVPQTFHAHATATTLQGAQQSIARGPAASQIAMKQLGTNGGGYYNSNSAVPFENPTGLSNFLEMLALMLIPAAQVFMFGKMVFARRHAWMVFAAMFVVFAIGIGVNLPAEQHGSQVLRASGVNITQGNGQSGGNMADKEVRFGQAATTNWTVATSDVSNGSVNSGFDAQTPAGGAVPLVNLFLGEVIFGGVGSGLYGMFFYILIAVFIAGLMVGRTPEYLGKKVESYEIKMAMITALVLGASILGFTALASALPEGLAGPLNAGPHGFSEILYAYSSQTGNNGSAFAGLTVNTPFYNITGGLAMLVGRYGMMIPILALAGSMAGKRRVAASLGTFPTTGILFGVLVVGVIIIVGALTFFPALALGPIVEQLLQNAGKVF